MTAAAIVHFDYAVLVVPFEDPAPPIDPSTTLVLRFDPPSIGKARKFFRSRNIGHNSGIFPKRMRATHACSALMPTRSIFWTASAPLLASNRALTISEIATGSFNPPSPPNRLEDIDARCTYGEERVQIIGMAERRILFVVVTMLNEEVCHIISARKADRHEQDRYYATDRENWRASP
jgi:uncharacterized DUF497 family protein